MAVDTAPLVGLDAFPTLAASGAAYLDSAATSQTPLSVIEAMDDSFATRYLNEGFSGGEKKRAEILQMALLEPTLAVLDETDSGLDIDALNVVANGVNTVARESEMGVLIITHYQRILHMVQPSRVSIMFEGRIVKEGGPELVSELEAKGYGWIKDEVAAGAAS